MKSLTLIFGPAAIFTAGAAVGDGPKNAPAGDDRPKGGQTGTVVVIQTSLGSIEVALDERNAPRTTRNFLSYVAQGFFDATVFHRIVRGFVIQGGGLTSDLRQKLTGPPVANESNNGLSNRRGTIAMARTSDPDSATSQFYINLRDNGSLDAAPGKPGYAVFGRVTAGMDVVDKIAVVRTHTARTPGGAPMEDVPVEPVVISSIRVKS